MSIEFTKEQKVLRKDFADFARAEISADAAKWDEQDYVPMELMPKMGKLGVLGSFVPKEYGGLGLGHVERCMALEEIARYSAGLAMMVFTHQLGMATILDYGSEEQKQKWLPSMCAGTSVCGLAVTESGGGSDLAGMKTEALIEGDTWTINGRKCFITNSHCEGVTVITCKSGEDDKGRALMSTIAIESGTEGFTPGRKENKSGLRGSYTGELVMNKAKVPLSNTVGKVGQGMAITMDELSGVGRASMSAIELGIIRACLEDAVAYSKERMLYGKAISKLQAIQFQIAEISCDYEAARLMTYNAATLKDEGKLGVEFYMAKYFISEAAVRSAKRLSEIMGGYGVVNDYSASRYLRDAIACIPACGTSEVQKLIIARDALKKDYSGSESQEAVKRVKSAEGNKSSSRRAGQMLSGKTPEEAAKAVLDIIKEAKGSKLSAEANTMKADIAETDIILCGGFGIGSAENREKLEKIAGKIGGSVACTRAALDAAWGYRENTMIGSSGRTISPKIYIGFGVSGSAHHTCGIKAAEVVININNDEKAESLTVSDYKGIFDASAVIDALLKLLS